MYDLKDNIKAFVGIYSERGESVSARGSVEDNDNTHSLRQCMFPHILQDN